jgi:long-chain fatty acid transport protein
MIGTALLAQSAWASGYHFGTQSVSSQATANASAAEAADPSTLFYNPAGLTKLEGTQATININMVAPKVKYSNGQAQYPEVTQWNDTTKQLDTVYPRKDPVQGSSSGKITDDVIFAPHLYASHQINDKFTIGLGTYVPFGSGTEYDHDSVLRYNLNELGLQTLAIQPTVAYKLNDRHSFAVGFIAQHTTAELRQYANFGPAVAGSLRNTGSQIATGLTQVASGNGAADGYAKVKGDDWGFGYNLAWLWDINERARVGMNYRSKISHTLKGDGEWHLVGNAFNDPVLGSTIQQGIRDRGYAEKEDASVKITTPESLSVHGMYKIDPKWNVYGDVTWTRHSRFSRADLMWGNEKDVTADENGNAKSNKTTLNPNWRNTYKVSLGASYQYSEPLQLRAGIAYDQSPVKNANYRMSTLPDNDRIWLSMGAKYDINRQHSVNVAYSHLFIKNATANVNGYCGGDSATSVACVSSKTNGSANFKSSANILGLQYTYKF